MSEKKPETKEITTPAGFPPITYDLTEAALQKLEADYAEVPDVETDEGYKETTDRVKKLTKYRTSVERRRKELKKPGMEYCAMVDSIARGISDRVTALEDRHKQAKQARDEREAKEAEERREREQRRLKEISDRIERIKTLGAPLAGTPLEALERALKALQDMEIGNDTFNEFTSEALEVRKAAVETVTRALEERRAYESQKAEHERQAAELQRQREEFEKQQADLRRQQEELARQQAELAAAQSVSDTAESASDHDTEQDEKQAQEPPYSELVPSGVVTHRGPEAEEAVDAEAPAATHEGAIDLSCLRLTQWAQMLMNAAAPDGLEGVYAELGLKAQRAVNGLGKQLLDRINTL